MPTWLADEISAEELTRAGQKIVVQQGDMLLERILISPRL